MTVRVEYSAGFTRNMGDFESLRVDLGVADDARAGESAVDAFNRVRGFVTDRLMDEVGGTEEEINRVRATIRSGKGYQHKVQHAAESEAE